MYEKLTQSSDFIRKKIKKAPSIGLVLGSGLGAFVEKLEDPTIIPYEDIPYFHSTSVEGHAGRIVVGEIEGTCVAIFQGRLHAYEGHSMGDIVFPIRTLSTLGAERLILTNAAGGINESFIPGDLVLINDHLNLSGKNPLVGLDVLELGPRFPDMTQTYSLKLQKEMQKIARELDIKLRSGVYCSVLGPTYETPAEVRMIRTLGGDMVGMSTVPEAIAARHMGMEICGLSCITNLAAGIGQNILRHEDIKTEAAKVMQKFADLLYHFIKRQG